MAWGGSQEEKKAWEVLVKSSSRRLIDIGKNFGFDMSHFEGLLVDEKLPSETRENLLKILFKAKCEALQKEELEISREGRGSSQTSDLVKFMQEMARMQMEAQVAAQAAQAAQAASQARMQMEAQASQAAAQLQMQKDIAESQLKFQAEMNLTLNKEKLARE